MRARGPLPNESYPSMGGGGPRRGGACCCMALNSAMVAIYPGYSAVLPLCFPFAPLSLRLSVTPAPRRAPALACTCAARGGGGR